MARIDHEYCARVTLAYLAQINHQPKHQEQPVSNGELKDQIADVILTTAVYQGREGDVVTSEDRDSETYLHCQNAARAILATLAHYDHKQATRSNTA